MKTQWNQIRRIVPGVGGDCILLMGSEKTALIDTGMTWCSDRLVKLLEEELEGRNLDFVLLTHTHYDHAGGVPALKRRWPGMEVVSSGYGKWVFQREGAQRQMHRLAKIAAAQYLGEEALERPETKELLEYPNEQMAVDLVVTMDQRINLGELTVKVLETPGHTNCSLSYYVEELKLIYPSESTGCFAPEGRIEPSVLTSFDQAIASTELCKAQGAEHVISPHFGLVEEMDADRYFEEALREIRDQREFLRVRLQAGKTMDEILEDCIQVYYETRTISKEEQPLEAFVINTKATIQLIQKEEETNDTNAE